MNQSKEQKHIIKQIESVSKKRKEIILSYLFGSFALGTTNRNSDVDIAIYLDSKKVKDLFDARLMLIKEFSQALKKDVDVVVLNTAKPFLKYVIIKEGKLVFQRDEGLKIDFEVKTLNEYFDFKPYMEMYQKAALNS
ncbi:MAG: nucleotidyltransferase domain-containing protein [Candidatus Pacebacteria bacterium]|nr:nucleotidyltransferase domain-containing protein [Candidatus Paceibacterota bacterium]